MMRILIFVGCVAAVLGACTTNDKLIAGAAAGAGTGALIGGPIGAVAGGAIGAVAAPTVTGSINKINE